MGRLKRGLDVCVMTKLVRHVNEMTIVAVKNVLIFNDLIFRQNVSMANNAMLHCGLTFSDIARIR